MSRPRIVTNSHRQEIQDLHAQGVSRNDIARRIGLSPGTITRVCRELGLPFTNPQTAVASNKRQAEFTALRQKIATELLGDVQKLRKQLWEECVIGNFGGKENTWNQVTLAQPTFRDKQAILTAAGIAWDKATHSAQLDTQTTDHSGVDLFIQHTMGDPVDT